ncbi:MAG: nitroreductase family protein [Acetatifactor sp.]|nr:nitroreductase family protein [Acetatifactor sp.]MDE7351454.1 nitroreductase family protein [Acetatifactor sp.]
MTAKECITGRRSIRRFTDQPVSHELLSRIVETASFAPSWKNTQITRYIAVEGEAKAALAKCTSLFPGNGAIMESAPVVIAVTIITGRSGYERDGSFSTPKGDRWQMYDAGIASEAFCLAAHEEGLGTVILGLFDEEEAAKLLNLPEGRQLAALIPVGYPAEAPAAPRRKTVEELLSFQS